MQQLCTVIPHNTTEKLVSFLIVIRTHSYYHIVAFLIVVHANSTIKTTAHPKGNTN